MLVNRHNIVFSIFILCLKTLPNPFIYCSHLPVIVILNKRLSHSFSISESMVFILNGCLRSIIHFKQILLYWMSFLVSQFRWKWSVSHHKYEADNRAFTSSGLECFLYSWIIEGLYPMNFSNIFSEHIEMVIWLFSLVLLGKCIAFTGCYMLNHAERHMPLR